MTALPRLERLLLDTDLDVDIQPYLEAVGFQTHFALRIEADERDDVALLRWARENHHILVCHDKHKDRSTRLELFPELNTNGGHILRITGDSSQDVLTALGKILVNREKWRTWFEDNDGVIILKMDGVIYRPAHELYRMWRSTLKELSLLRDYAIVNQYDPASARPAQLLRNRTAC